MQVSLTSTPLTLHKTVALQRILHCIVWILNYLMIILYIKCATNKQQTCFLLIFPPILCHFSSSGYRHWHADLRPDDTPLEAGLAFTCKLKSSIPFQGRDKLEKQKEEGLRRRIVCFTIDESVKLLSWHDVFVRRKFEHCSFQVFNINLPIGKWVRSLPQINS